jgi:hypothetical protein
MHYIVVLVSSLLNFSLFLIEHLGLILDNLFEASRQRFKIENLLLLVNDFLLHKGVLIILRVLIATLF